MHRKLHGYALSPDQQRIAQLETSTYFTKSGYEDRRSTTRTWSFATCNGKLLHEHKNVDNGTEDANAAHLAGRRSGPGRCTFRAASPAVRSPLGVRRRSADAVRHAVRPGPVRRSSGERRLMRDGRTLVYFDTRRSRALPLRTAGNHAHRSSSSAPTAT